MPYCLIGKIVIWGGGLAILAVLAYALIMAYDRIAHRWRKRLLGSPPRKFLIESISTEMCKIACEVLHRIGLRRLNAWMQDAVMQALLTAILAVFIPPAFLELGLRYTLYRLRRTTAPSVLA